jgi:LacI family transcriptional regulator
VPLDANAVGFNAAAMLESLMDGRPIESQMVQVPPLPIVERRSSDAFAVSDPDVVAAMRFIWNRAAVFTSVDDVLQDAAVSARTLQLQFRKSLGRTIQQEIWRIHVERAKTLLGETTLSISEIAEASGFRSAQSLSEIFRRQVGMSPSEHRRRVRPKG